MKTSQRFALLIVAIAIGAGCSMEQSQHQHGPTGPGGGGGDNQALILNTTSLSLQYGAGCSNVKFQITANRAVSYRTTTGVVSVSANGVVTTNKVGEDTVVATAFDNSSLVGRVPVKVASCGSDGGGGGGGVALGFKSVAPLEITVLPNTPWKITGVITRPSNVTTAIHLRSKGCVARASEPVFSATNAANEYSFELMAVAISPSCGTDDVVLKLTADTTKVSPVMKVHITAPTAGSVKIAPKSVTGPVGLRGKHTCTVTGLTDLRCWFYSKDPSIVVVIQKDTTLATGINPWAVGFHPGGEYYRMWSGTTEVCAFSPQDPKYVDCAAHIYASASVSGNLLMDVLPGTRPYVEVELPEILRQVLKLPAI